MLNDHWNSKDYDLHAGYVSQLNQEVITDLSAKNGECILDIGCGTGEISQSLLELGCSVIGIDSSQDMVDAAKKRGVNAYLADALEISNIGTFDAVFSNATLHWIPNQKELACRVIRALRPGGRFVAEMGGHGNIASICRAMATALEEIGDSFESRNPWTFPRPAEQRNILEEAGFEVRKISIRDRVTVLSSDIFGWLNTFTSKLLEGLGSTEKQSVIERTASLCEPELYDPKKGWIADYVRLNFIAFKPH